jgi:phosphoribosyl 1,2-cyclic phosphodiesterase
MHVNAEGLTVRFWGTRGHYPVPGSSTLRYGGNTPCVEVQIGDYPLILDGGTGIANLGHDLLRRARQDGGFTPIRATVLLTHTHHDHTQGLPFFAPLYIGSSKLHILVPYTVRPETTHDLARVVVPRAFPLRPDEMPSFQMIRGLYGNELLLLDPHQGKLHFFDSVHDSLDTAPDDAAYIHILKSITHPRYGVYIYRIEWRGRSLVFATDTEGYVGIDQHLAAFARNTDLLIHDAQYTAHDYAAGQQGWGHSTPEMACAVAQACGAERLILFHHAPTYDDEQVAHMEATAQQLFPNAQAAYEGLEISLPARTVGKGSPS